MLVFNIPKAWHVNAVRSPSENGFIFVPGDGSDRSPSLDVIHQVVSEFAAGISKPGGEFGGRRVKQNAYRLQGRRTEEKYLRPKLSGCPSLGIDHADSNCSSSFGIEDNAV